MDHGVPFDVAFSYTPAELKGWGVIFGEMNSNSYYDWDSETWVERR